MTEPQSDSTMVVECCGVLEELCGGPEYRLRLPHIPISVAELIERLAAEQPAARDMLARTACAVGDHIVSRERLLQRGERLVLLPPVSGG